MKDASHWILAVAASIAFSPLSLFAQAPSPLSSPSPCPAATASTIDSPIIKELQGRWHNDFLPPQKASTLYIKKIDPQTGAITGTYTSPIGGGPKEFPLVGWVTTSAPESGSHHVIVLSFTVSWGEYGTITAWNGFYTCPEGGEKPVIVEQWILSQPNSQFPWGHILAGQDRYHKFAED